MKIVDIFAPHLYAIRVTEGSPDEFENLFDLWTDVEYLEEFFENNFDDLKNGFYKVNSVEEAVFTTLEQAESLQNKLYELSTTTNDIASINETLDSLFKSLDNILNDEPFQKSKAYGFPKPSWLRVYAIRLTSNKYIITGGAIKLTLYMNERENTNSELSKLRMVMDFLKEEGVYDIDGFKELLIDL